jgi:hypothetical protein
MSFWFWLVFAALAIALAARFLRFALPPEKQGPAVQRFLIYSILVLLLCVGYFVLTAYFVAP